MSKKLKLAAFVTIDEMPSESRIADAQAPDGLCTAYLEVRADNASVIGVIAVDYTTQPYEDRYGQPKVRILPHAIRTFTRDELVFGELEKR